MLSVSAIDGTAEIVSADSQSTYVGDMKKMIILLIHQILMIMCTFFEASALNTQILPSLMLSVSVFNDDVVMVGADL